MQKTAQKRSLLNKLREMTNVSGIAAEKFFNPEFEDVMTRLRDNTDDPVRAIITGEQIGDAEPPGDGMSLKALLSSAKSNLNRREYMKSISNLGRFHKKMYDVVNILSGFKSTLDSVHEKFLFQDLDDESKEHLHDLHNRFSPKKTSAATQPYFLKQANILDFFANIGTERGRALGAWEKRYPKQVAALKKSSATMLSQSEKLLSTVLSVLKEMASARAVRNPDKYILAASKVIKAYENYDNLFKTYYSNHVKPFENVINGFAPKKVDTSDKPDELGDKEVAPESADVDPKDLDVPTLPRNNLPKDLSPQSVLSKSPSVVFPLVQRVPSSGVEDLSPEDIQTIPPSNTQRVRDTQLSPSPAGDTVPAAAPNTEISPAPSSGPPVSKFKSDEVAEQMWGKAHNKFYEALSKMSGESPVVLSLFIKKYASSIQKNDPATAIQLLNVAKSIKG